MAKAKDEVNDREKALEMAMTVAQQLISVHADVCDLSVCHQLGNTPARGKQNQGRHHGLYLKLCNQKSVKAAAHHGRCQSCQHSQDVGIGILIDRHLTACQDPGTHSRSHCHDSAHGNIGSGGGRYHQGHAHSQHHQLAGTVDYVNDISVEDAVINRNPKKRGRGNQID